MDLVQEVQTQSELEGLLNSESDVNIIIKFGAKWCVPCNRIKPLIEELAKKRNDIKFYSVDVDKISDHPVVEKIRSLPTIRKYYKGKLISEVVGSNEVSIRNLVMTY